MKKTFNVDIIYKHNNYSLIKYKEKFAIVEYDEVSQHYQYTEVEGDIKLYLINQMNKLTNSLKCYMFNTEAAKLLDFMSSLYVYAFCQDRH